jgi:hypothetical protein
MPERAKPIRPISQVNVTARRMSTYCERGAIVPQRIVPVERAPLNIGMSIAITTTIAPSTAMTW